MTCDVASNRLLALPDPTRPTDDLLPHLGGCAACRAVQAEAVRLDALEIDDIRPVQHGDGGGLRRHARQFGQHRGAEMGQRLVGQIGLAQFHHARRQAEFPPIRHGIAQLRQRQQVAARHGAGLSGDLGKPADGQPLMARAEGADHREAAFQRLDRLAAPCRHPRLPRRRLVPSRAGPANSPRHPGIAALGAQRTEDARREHRCGVALTGTAHPEDCRASETAEVPMRVPIPGAGPCRPDPQSRPRLGRWRRHAAVGALALLGAGMLPGAALADYWVYCIHGRVRIESRPPADVGRSYIASSICAFQSFVHISDARSFAQRNWRGEGQACSCR